jgi:hypothetical protein
LISDLVERRNAAVDRHDQGDTAGFESVEGRLIDAVPSSMRPGI